MRSIILLNKASKVNLEIFFEFVEIKTKLASLMPMLAGFLWTYLYYGQMRWWNTIVFFIAVILFDMTVTAINNTMDYYKAKDEAYKYHENVIGKFGLDFKQMVTMTLTLLVMALFFSIGLFFMTDPMLLMIGGIFYLIGITYTFGPLPTSRTPLGELLSGTIMGFGIFFLAVFVNHFDQILSSQWTAETIQIVFHWPDILRILFMSLPFIALIANIMLANNTCDLETDRRNHRYTLVHYIGRNRAVRLYQVLSVIPWICWILYILSGQLPLWTLIGLLGMYPHFLSIQRFSHKQVKSETFAESLKSFLLFSIIYNGALLMAIII